MARSVRLLSAMLLAVSVAACGAGDEIPYARVWGGDQGTYSAEAVPTARSLREFEAAPPWSMQSAAADRVAADQPAQDAQVRALAVSRSGILRTAALGRQEESLRDAERAHDIAARALDHAEREHRRARWRDLSPISTGPFDRADSERRDAELAARVAASAERRAARTVERAEVRLGLSARAHSAQERMELIDRMRERNEARQRLALTRSPVDAEVRRLLPYRRPGEQVEAFRKRVRQAQDRAGGGSASVEAILRGGFSG